MDMEDNQVLEELRKRIVGRIEGRLHNGTWYITVEKYFSHTPPLDARVWSEKETPPTTTVHKSLLIRIDVQIPYGVMYYSLETVADTIDLKLVQLYTIELMRRGYQR